MIDLIRAAAKAARYRSQGQEIYNKVKQVYRIADKLG